MSSRLPHDPGALSLLLLSLIAGTVHAASQCKAEKLDIPVALTGMRAVVSAKINGQDARFALDSGAFYSMITSASAAQFNLHLRPVPINLIVKGGGGSVLPSLTTVKEFSLANVTLHNQDFLVGGSEIGGENVGLLGQNFLRIFDVEYDLANGVVRLFTVEGCRNVRLAYWLTPGQAYSLIEGIEYTTPMQPHTIGTVYVNGKKMHAMFDTGAPTSMLSLKAARQAGVDLDTPGVVESYFGGGIGRGKYKTYVAPFSSFKVGDSEEIRNARLRISDIDLDNADMLIGADFFLSHRLYVANSQRKIYLTYNGGAVFNLGKRPVEITSAEAKKDQEELTDAAALASRGEGFADRRDYEHAIADLTRACELDPTEPEYAFQRGMAYWANRQPQLAGADFDRALSLKPDLAPALMARAEMRLRSRDLAAATADLDAADKVAPKQADSRLTLAALYVRADRSQSAIAQYDLWIANHPDDSKMIDALNGSCWIRAMQGIDLDRALNDCDKAIWRVDKKSSPGGYAKLLDSRGFTRLRRGEFDKAIADFDAAVKLDPRKASSLFGRGTAKLRKLKTAEGQADIAAAAALQPKITEYFDRHGIVP
jgi:tetratricopeptide (TPR) repeat protein/predicted aspartyl protease